MCQDNRIMLQILISLVHNHLQIFSDENQKTAAERSHCVCRRAENVASQDRQEFGLLHKQETERWRSRWLLPSSDVISPGGLNTPDLIVCLTTAHTQETHCRIQHSAVHYNTPTPQTMAKQRYGLLQSYCTNVVFVQVFIYPPALYGHM